MGNKSNTEQVDNRKRNSYWTNIKKIILFDDTQYNYRVYVLDNNGNYKYSDIISFKTNKRKNLETVNIDIDFSGLSTESYNLHTSPNRFVLNNFLLNKPNDLKLIIGNDYNGINGILSNTDDNIATGTMTKMRKNE